MSEMRKFDEDAAEKSVRRVLGWHLDQTAVAQGLVDDLVRELGYKFGDGRCAGMDYACDQWEASMGTSTKEGA